MHLSSKYQFIFTFCRSIYVPWFEINTLFFCKLFNLSMLIWMHPQVHVHVHCKSLTSYQLVHTNGLKTGSRVALSAHTCTVEPRYNEVLGTMKITLLYQVSHYIRVKKQRNIKSWDQQNYLVIRGFCYIRPLYNEVPLYRLTDYMHILQYSNISINLSKSAAFSLQNIRNQPLTSLESI